jgi:5,10-methylenetetrahydromethanopterin reductase
MEGKRRRIRFLNPELELINLRDPVRLHISAYGTRSRALTAKFGAGWLNFIGALQSGVADLRQMQQAWKAAGHELQDLSATAFGLGRGNRSKKNLKLSGAGELRDSRYPKLRICAAP